MKSPYVRRDEWLPYTSISVASGDRGIWEFTRHRLVELAIITGQRFKSVRSLLKKKSFTIECIYGFIVVIYLVIDFLFNKSSELKDRLYLREVKVVGKSNFWNDNRLISLWNKTKNFKYSKYYNSEVPTRQTQ